MEIMNKQDNDIAGKYFHKKRVCPVCGTEYQPKNSRRVYCSPLCRWRAFSMKKTGELAGIDKGIHAFQTENKLDLQTQNQRKIEKEALAPTENQRKTNGELRESENDVSAANANPTESKEGISDTNAKQTENAESIPDPNGKQTQTQRKTNAEPTENSTDSACIQHLLNEESSFTGSVGDTVNERGLDEKFICPSEHWPSEQAGAIGKVNKYLRCLLDCTLKLCGRRKIPATALRDLANGYAYLLNSDTFIISEHPYKEHIVHLHGYLSAYYKKYRSHPRLRLVVKRHDKIEITAMLHEIGNSVPPQKFSELFHTPST